MGSVDAKEKFSNQPTYDVNHDEYLASNGLVHLRCTIVVSKGC